MTLCNTFEGFGLRFHVAMRGETPSGPLSRVAISPREGSDVRGYAPCLTAEISIHAPREGSDLSPVSIIYLALMFSIHAPREGSDPGFANHPILH